MSKQNNTGIGFTGLLTIAFIVLKLMGHITWSWWWVTAPIWIGGFVCLLTWLLLFIIWLVSVIIEGFFH